eukprot:CAMPEP_0198141844 /NCGR_PEP_ID=MMETSP1443-20131203/4779_1 /TAXON_ID=186043 /ORGANISM="Entomoneis sp., Strain CCMP2396" /LENGTH=250 /DNA_ID=CAMNT_0043804715 /DNA_START=163 /DNA_END=915 /DNA_ORIENTATION=-
MAGPINYNNNAAHRAGYASTNVLASSSAVASSHLMDLPDDAHRGLLSSLWPSSSSPRQMPWKTTVTVVSILSITGVSAYFFWTLVQQYGLEGARNYIWEGDPYPHIRQYLNALDSISKQLSKEEKQLAILQEALERAQLDSVDQGQTDEQGDTTLLTAWQENIQKSRSSMSNNKIALSFATSAVDLTLILGGLSYKLDQLAAKIDAVPSAQDKIVKKNKKNLSTRIVKLMGLADQLIALYQKLSAGGSAQ